jgi:hypothetical protein
VALVAPGIQLAVRRPALFDVRSREITCYVEHRRGGDHH